MVDVSLWLAQSCLQSSAGVLCLITDMVGQGRYRSPLCIHCCKHVVMTVR